MDVPQEVNQVPQSNCLAKDGLGLPVGVFLNGREGGAAVVNGPYGVLFVVLRHWLGRDVAGGNYGFVVIVPGGHRIPALRLHLVSPCGALGEGVLILAAQRSEGGKDLISPV